MDAKLQARCDQQIKNEKALRIMSTQVSEPSIKVGSLLYTSLDLPVSDDNVYAAQQILETKGRFFSNFRGVLQALILLRMAVSKKPEAYIDTIIDTYDRLEKEAGISGLFTVLSSVIITEQHKDQEIGSVVKQVADLFEHIRSSHLTPTCRPSHRHLPAD